jgi:hypothetical protein
MTFCYRCSCPVEEPITYADELLARAGEDRAQADRIGHAAVCVHCADVTSRYLVD